MSERVTVRPQTETPWRESRDGRRGPWICAYFVKRVCSREPDQELRHLCEVHARNVRLFMLGECHACGEPRGKDLKTCGGRSCVTAVRNRAMQAKPGPGHTDASRRRISVGMRASWKRRKEEAA